LHRIPCRNRSLGILILSFVLGSSLVSPAAQAEEDSTRPKNYIGAGVAVSFDEFNDNGLFDFDTPVGAKVTIGRRVNESYAVEIDYNYSGKFKGDRRVFSFPFFFNGSPLTVQSHSIMVNLRATPIGVVLNDRFEPYVFAGLGAVIADTSFGPRDEDFAGRIGGGFNVLLTDTVEYFVDASYLFTTGAIGGTDLITLAAGFRVAFRLGDY